MRPNWFWNAHNQIVDRATLSICARLKQLEARPLKRISDKDSPWQRAGMAEDGEGETSVKWGSCRGNRKHECRVLDHAISCDDTSDNCPRMLCGFNTRLYLLVMILAIPLNVFCHCHLTFGTRYHAKTRLEPDLESLPSS